MNVAPTIEQRRRAFLDAMRRDVADKVAAALRGRSEDVVRCITAVEGLVDRNFVQLEATTDALRARGAYIPRIACRKGCGTCCHIRVSLSVPELLRITSHLRESLSADELSSLLERCHAYLEALAGLDALERSVASIPCVFLQEDQACSIHPVRAIACRRHHSLDLKACLRAHQSPAAEGVPQNLEHATVTQPIVDGIDHGTLMARKVVRRIDLVRGLVLAFETDAESRWLAGEDSFAEAEDREFLALAAQNA